jgi:hypothetical protein
MKRGKIIAAGRMRIHQVNCAHSEVVTDVLVVLTSDVMEPHLSEEQGKMA